MTGAMAVYITCTGSGKLTLSYETDPGRTDSKDAPDWFAPSFSNPVEKEMNTGKLAIAVSVVLGQYLRFKLEATGGDVTITSFKFVSL
jgi:hypothetical protein